MDGSKIGYKPDEEEALKEAIKTAFEKVKGAMNDPWPTFVGVADAEWVGPDEVAAKKSLAKKLKECYQSCVEIVQELGDNINEIHDSWKTMQESFHIDNGEDAEKGKIQDLDAFTVTADEPELTVEDRDFAKSDFMGLVNGLPSAQKVHEAAVDYANTVKKSIQELYDAIETNKAYFGSQQVEAIKNLIVKIGEILQNLTTAFKDVDIAINAAMKKYEEQEGTVAETANSYNKDVDSSNFMTE